MHGTPVCGMLHRVFRAWQASQAFAARFPGLGRGGMLRINVGVEGEERGGGNKDSNAYYCH